MPYRDHTKKSDSVKHWTGLFLIESLFSLRRVVEWRLLSGYCWAATVERGGLLAGAAHPRRQKHREMPPPGASAPAFAAAVAPACTQLAAGGRIFVAAPTTAGGLFFFAATKIRIGRVSLLRQGQVPRRRLFT